METVSTLINEYLSITGRPAATLSVSEFMTFKEYADKELSTPREKLISDVPNAEHKEEIKQSKPDVKASLEKKEEVTKIIKLEKTDNQPETHTENNILSMLKSVPG
nr:hypothetical protein [uncultured Butyrivibrio sp.]